MAAPKNSPRTSMAGSTESRRSVQGRFLELTPVASPIRTASAEDRFAALAVVALG